MVWFRDGVTVEKCEPRRGRADYIKRGGETLSLLGQVSELWASREGTAGLAVGQERDGSVVSSASSRLRRSVGMCSSSGRKAQGRVAGHWTQGIAGKAGTG